jgi:hypothetical protein
MARTMAMRMQTPMKAMAMLPQNPTPPCTKSLGHLRRVSAQDAPSASVRPVRALEQGPHGGYRLAKPAASITLLEVVEAVDGPVRVEAWVAAGSRGPLNGHIREVCEAVAGLVRRRLGRVRLSDLAGGR